MTAYTQGSSSSSALKIANYETWNNDPFVTLNQVIYLAAGFEPRPSGMYELDYLKLPDKDFIAFYERVKRIKRELPLESNKKTEVLDQSQREPAYEAAFLVKLLKSRNIPVNANYTPVMSDQRKRTTYVNQFLGMDVVSIDEFASLLSVFNGHIDSGEKHFKRILLGAMEVGKINAIPSTQHYDTPIEEREFKFSLLSLIKLSEEKGFDVPIELSSADGQSAAVSANKDRGDLINTNKLNSMLLMILAMVVSKYGYIPSNKRNSATGLNRGSIRADVQALGSTFDRKDLNLDINEGTVKSIVDEAVDKFLS